jgi:hypothetical protein
MRGIVLGTFVLFAPLLGCAPFVYRYEPDTAFAANSPHGMLVVAENTGTGIAAGRYRFARIDRDARRVIDQVEFEVGAGIHGSRAEESKLFGQRPDSPLVTHMFHYAFVPPGEYALFYMDSSDRWEERWWCLSIYQVTAGVIAVVHAPDRGGYNMFTDNAQVRAQILRSFPSGTTFEYLQSREKAAQDFEEIVATNPLLTAPHGLVSSIGTLAFEARTDARRDQCVPAEGLTITPERH